MIKGKLRKILEMAKRAEGNEAEAAVARNLFQELLKKHGLEMSDILDQDRRHFWVSYSLPYEKELIFQIAARVLRVSNIPFLKRKSNTKSIGFNMTPLEWAEFQNYWKTYRKPMVESIKKYIEATFTAFISKHHLTNPDGSDDKELTPEELRRLRLAMEIQRKLENIASPNRQIEE